MKKLFNNQTVIKSSLELVKENLLNFEQLGNWNPAIVSVQSLSENSFVVYRNGDALNVNEEITVQEKGNQVIYQSTKGKIEYRLVFELTDSGEYTKVSESFYMTNEIQLPLTLLTPIAQHAFNQNLNGLKQLIELQVTKM